MRFSGLGQWFILLAVLRVRAKIISFVYYSMTTFLTDTGFTLAMNTIDDLLVKDVLITEKVEFPKYIVIANHMYIKRIPAYHLDQTCRLLFP